MKNLVILINVVVIIGVAAILNVPEDLQSDVNDQHRKKPSKATTESRHTLPSDFAGFSKASKTKSDEFVTSFITEMAEARLMDLEEGKIAQQRCTTKDLKSYGTLMVNDQ